MRAAAGLHAWWLRAAGPSLVRRLLLAQLGMLALLWALLLGALVWSVSDGKGVLDDDTTLDAVLTVAQELADRPEPLLRSLRAADRALYRNWGDNPDSARLAPELQVWRGGQLLYRSEGAAPLLRVAPGAAPVRVTLDGTRWLARSRASADGHLVGTLVLADARQLALTLNSRGLYLVPLVISLPLLALPAWGAVHLALRPWRRLSQDVAARGPRDLQPLASTPPHRELQPLVGALNDLLARLRAGSARERNLIADAAHELRTPLAAMHVGVEALGRHDVPQELMANLLRSTRRAARLVDQLLRLMRSEATAEDAQQAGIALDELVPDRLAAFDALARARGVELEYDGDAGLCVHGEREGLESLVDNLVDNAIKYSPTGAAVSVEVRAAGDWVRIEVADRGPGIAAQWRERVFDRFFRVPDQSQNGSGLGLAIVRSVVLRHEGRIELLPRAGGGLRVRVELPWLGNAHC
ncbi:ATP-binding protein [Roseateles sp.]|uniref:sensor histidine kinase n=1 Tax=Roseateles sp. TaxID=1971397 RepID=UPI0025D10494|nr:ATP-binding protein [Roseateles sp.]MBV8033684.1 sensor histidine kinase [Roseateles sp.]